MSRIVHALRFLSSYFAIVRDPNDLTRIFRLLDDVGEVDHEGVTEFLAQPAVAEFLARDTPALRVDLDELRALPEGTLGRAFATFIDRQGFDPHELHWTDPDSEDPLTRMQTHLGRSHDLWHVVTGFDTDVAGEVGLQAFYIAQLGMPPASAILSATLLNGILRDPKDLGRRVAAIAIGWYYGRGCAPLFGTDWASLWSEPLIEVRRRFGIDAAKVASARELDAPTLAQGLPQAA